ncbi:glycosyl hydrolase family 61-domain-containing protein [Neurospora tetraspora]|uniref:lytic cellulose monooxygenase (C4-dehydrogenating) n=1 Tax=Neurospora tetraspora TaxID=94610 RepID=A0AAE0MXJ1_9PEZI|nr:glycosyl hydrolase family 61-domain-containing protein [Neurospora tetraspora]
MKTGSILAALVASASAHTIFQKVSVNGADQGQLKGIRAPANNNPVTNVQSSDMACNAVSIKDSNVLTVPAGAKVGHWWGHEIGGASGPNDADNPIAASHKGPVIVYLAKVDNAATTGTSGLKWFKVAEAGLSGGKWAVDDLIANNGWSYFNMPTCIAPGQYLMRAEIIALHNAGSPAGAQLYIGCAQINVTGGGSSSPSSTVSFPGAYSASDPGILLNIYGSSGKTDNGGKPYQIPGPSLFTCSGSGNDGGSGGSNPAPTTKASTPQPTTKASTPQPTNGGGSGTGAALYGQCGGKGFTGPTTCASGTCKFQNDWYSQCLN